jgi:hypothetical protein
VCVLVDLCAGTVPINCALRLNRSGMDVRGIAAKEMESLMLGNAGSQVKLGFEAAKRTNEQRYYEISLMRR